MCLGHQCIGSTFGAKVGYAGEVKHGKVSVITHDEKGVFKNIKNFSKEYKDIFDKLEKFYLDN